MRQTILTLALLVLLVSGCVPIETDPAAGRTTIAEARQACANWFLPSEFAAAVDGVRFDRADDASPSATVLVVIDNCENHFACVNDPFCASVCISCWVEVIAAVYDE